MMVQNMDWKAKERVELRSIPSHTIVIAYKIRETFIAIISSPKFCKMLSSTESLKCKYPVSATSKYNTNDNPTDNRVTRFHRALFALANELKTINLEFDGIIYCIQMPRHLETGERETEIHSHNDEWWNTNAKLIVPIACHTPTLIKRSGSLWSICSDSLGARILTVMQITTTAKTDNDEVKDNVLIFRSHDSGNMKINEKMVTINHRCT